MTKKYKNIETYFTKIFTASYSTQTQKLMELDKVMTM